MTVVVQRHTEFSTSHPRPSLLFLSFPALDPLSCSHSPQSTKPARSKAFPCPAGEGPDWGAEGVCPWRSRVLRLIAVSFFLDPILLSLGERETDRFFSELTFKWKNFEFRLLVRLFYREGVMEGLNVRAFCFSTVPFSRVCCSHLGHVLVHFPLAHGEFLYPFMI